MLGSVRKEDLKFPSRNLELTLPALAPLAGAARPRFRGAEDPQPTSGLGGAGCGDRRLRSSMLLFCGLGIRTLSPAESLCAEGSRDPTETPRSSPPLCERERHESREKEKLLRIRAGGYWREMGRPPLTVKCLVQIALKCTELETGCFMILSGSLLLSAFKSIDCFKLMKVLLSKGAFIVGPWRVQYLPFTLPKWACLKRETPGVPTGTELGAERHVTMRINKNQCPSNSERRAFFFFGPVSSVRSCLAFWTFTVSDFKCCLVSTPFTPLSALLYVGLTLFN